MAGNFYDKFPAEILEFEFDATDILTNGDTISSVTVDQATEGLSIVGTPTFIGNIVTFRCSGGTAGRVARAVANVTTAAGLYRQGLLHIVIKPLL